MTDGIASAEAWGTATLTDRDAATVADTVELVRGSSVVATGPVFSHIDAAEVTELRLYTDESGASYYRTYIPVPPEHVARLRAQHKAGKVRLTVKPVPTEDLRSAEMAWLYAHFDELQQKHAGEWVAIDGPRLVAHAHDLPSLIAFARAAGSPDPFITSIPGELPERLNF